jgi:hypothetical protein
MTWMTFNTPFKWNPGNPLSYKGLPLSFHATGIILKLVAYFWAAQLVNGAVAMVTDFRLARRNVTI